MIKFNGNFQNKKILNLLNKRTKIESIFKISHNGFFQKPTSNIITQLLTVKISVNLFLKKELNNFFLSFLLQ